MNTLMNRIIMVILSVMLSVACSSGEFNGSGDNLDGSESFGKILPVMDWGIDKQTIKSMQSNELELEIETDSYLRYTNNQKNVVLGYNFENDK